MNNGSFKKIYFWLYSMEVTNKQQTTRGSSNNEITVEKVLCLHDN